MQKSIRSLLALGVLAVAIPAGASQWLHVSVTKSGSDAESVRVNLPLSVAEAFLPTLENQIGAEIQKGLADQPVAIQDIRNAWKELRKQKSTELVAVDSKEAKVRVSITGNNVVVRSTEDSEKNVNVQVPVSVVDALLSGEGNTLELSAALKELMKIRQLDLVKVQDAENSVQIWIDNKNEF